jgi:prepilin-type N-terminal cleavage/methylation domain-containing protein
MPTPGAIAAFEQLHAPCSPRLRRGVALRRTTSTGMASDHAAGPGAANARGMTLVEILVVLALLVVIGGLVVPVFEGSIASVRLRRAGDQVVTGWSRARAEAIESGQPYQFRFTPDTGTFVIEPWTGLFGEESNSAASKTTPGSTSTSTTNATTTSPTASTANSTAATSAVANMALPEEIVFQGGELAVEDFQSGERSVASLQDAGESLSTPILFFPDGTASEASVLLTNGKKQFVRVTLRGLTGVGRASEVLTQEELQRADRRK